MYSADIPSKNASLQVQITGKTFVLKTFFSCLSGEDLYSGTLVS